MSFYTALHAASQRPYASPPLKTTGQARTAGPSPSLQAQATPLSSAIAHGVAPAAAGIAANIAHGVNQISPRAVRMWIPPESRIGNRLGGSVRVCKPNLPGAFDKLLRAPDYRDAPTPLLPIAAALMRIVASYSEPEQVRDMALLDPDWRAAMRVRSKEVARLLNDQVAKEYWWNRSIAIYPSTNPRHLELFNKYPLPGRFSPKQMSILDVATILAHRRDMAKAWQNILDEEQAKPLDNSQMKGMRRSALLTELYKGNQTGAYETLHPEFGGFLGRSFRFTPEVVAEVLRAILEPAAPYLSSRDVKVMVDRYESGVREGSEEAIKEICRAGSRHVTNSIILRAFLRASADPATYPPKKFFDGYRDLIRKCFNYPLLKQLYRAIRDSELSAGDKAAYIQELFSTVGTHALPSLRADAEDVLAAGSVPQGRAVPKTSRVRQTRSSVPALHRSPMAAAALDNKQNTPQLSKVDRGRKDMQRALDTERAKPTHQQDRSKLMRLRRELTMAAIKARAVS